ncbi:MAG: hypothetical protein BLM47_10310 [Candidatus Reconcilbacillus cellulovorans]|uniref:CheW-like domain-containing protein n=1 Tax=Candidatus Reconcilbacillus cellulovorans TaxID=1906605 RepID=A0A2A6DYW3_9BACL|nr:MAG: hypothetical protein BLM47_10310 [Candidatus Reconcilbacillus cellulovorans]
MVAEKNGQYVTFEIHGGIYGVPIESVQEIIRYRRVAQIYNTPSHVEGLIHYRGKIIPVFSIRKLLRLPESAPGKSTVIIVLRVGDKTVGMIGDRVRHIIRVAPEDVEPVHRSFISAILKADDQLVMLLDVSDKWLEGKDRD